MSLESEKKDIIYCRVRSKKQLLDLDRQIKLLRSLYPAHELVTDCASGINFARKGLDAILEYAVRGSLKELVVAHRDRLCRFGFELIDAIITKLGDKIVVLDDQERKSSEQELAEDLLAIGHIYSCRQMGRRRYKVKSLEIKLKPTPKQRTILKEWMATCR